MFEEELLLLGGDCNGFEVALNSWQLPWLCFASAVKEWRRSEATLHTATSFQMPNCAHTFSPLILSFQHLKFFIAVIDFFHKMIFVSRYKLEREMKEKSVAVANSLTSGFQRGLNLFELKTSAVICSYLSKRAKF